jgi:hypothetical protein
MTANSPWPPLPLSEWSDTCDTLHLWTQIVGKVRLSLTPLVNHWWNVTLYVTSRGLSTSPIPNGRLTFEILFDFIDHQLRIEASDGATEHMALHPMPVADFYAQLMALLRKIGVQVHIWTMPSEIENAIRFELDRTHAQYDPAMVERFWQALVQADRLFKLFSARFIGKISPVHFFWGSFDLAVTRFSGRTAPAPGGVTPHVAPGVMTEAYSHEVCSCGFWPGNGGYGRAAFNVYAYPEPAGLGDTPLRTPEAFYDNGLGQFIVPYDAVRKAPNPEELLLGFLQETYEAAAALGKWDRQALERQKL